MVTPSHVLAKRVFSLTCWHIVPLSHAPDTLRPFSSTSSPPTDPSVYTWKLPPIVSGGGGGGGFPPVCLASLSGAAGRWVVGREDDAPSFFVNRLRALRSLLGSVSPVGGPARSSLTCRC
eukprot:scaffold6786_cov112-Isochrysis_galbana.AAC.2